MVAKCLCPMEKGIHGTTQVLMQEYSNLVDLIGLELSSTETRYKKIVKKFERSQTTWAEWIELKETLAHANCR